MLRAAWVAIGVIVAACGGPPSKTTDELRAAIAAYERGEPGADEERIAALFARVDADIASLRAEELGRPPGERAGVAAEREALVAERSDLAASWTRARIARLGDAAGQALRGVADQLGQGLEDAGRALRESAGDAPSR